MRPIYSISLLILLLIMILGGIWWVRTGNLNLEYAFLTFRYWREFSEPIQIYAENTADEERRLTIDIRVVYEFTDNCSVVLAVYHYRQGQPNGTAFFVFHQLERVNGEWSVAKATSSGRLISVPDNIGCSS
jgi:hypothetical protein